MHEEKRSPIAPSRKQLDLHAKWVPCKQVSSRMQDLLTSPALSQSGHQEADVFLHQRADPAASSGLDISPIHHHDGLE